MKRSQIKNSNVREFYDKMYNTNDRQSRRDEILIEAARAIGRMPEKKDEQEYVPAKSAFDTRANAKTEAPVAVSTLPEETAVQTAVAEADDDELPELPFEPDTTEENETVAPDEKETDTIDAHVASAAAVPARLKEYKEPKWIDHNYKNPTLYDLASYIRVPVEDHRLIVGEEDTGIVAGLCLLNLTCFGIEGKSGSAKTILMDKILNLIPKDYIEEMRLGSAKAMNYSSQSINTKKILYLPEINHLIPCNAGKKETDVEKTLKLLGEGKAAEMTVVKGTKTLKFVIDPIPACYTRAIENAFDVRPELRRRFVVVETKSTQEQVEGTHIAMNNDRHTLWSDNSNEKKLVDTLREHFTNLINLEGVDTFDPFSDYLINVIPKTEKSKCYLDQYYSMLDACAKFHFAERKKFKLRKKIDGEYREKLVLFLNLEDHYQVYKSFHRQFVNSLKSYEDDQFKDAIDQLPEKVDWKAYMDCGLRQMQNNSQISLILKKDADFVDKWYMDQLTGTEVFTIDYMTGQQEKMTDI